MISYEIAHKVDHIRGKEEVRGLVEAPTGEVIVYYCVPSEGPVIGELVRNSMLSISRDKHESRGLEGFDTVSTLVQLDSGVLVCGQERGLSLCTFAIPVEAPELSCWAITGNGFHRSIRVGPESFIFLTVDYRLLCGRVHNEILDIYRDQQFPKVEMIKFNHGKVVMANCDGGIYLLSSNLELVREAKLPYPIGSVEYLHSGMLACGTNYGDINLFIDYSDPDPPVYGLSLTPWKISNWIWGLKELTNKVLVSGASDGTIGFWDGNHSYNLLSTLSLDPVVSIIELRDETIVVNTQRHVEFIEFRATWTLQLHSYFPLHFKRAIKFLLLLKVENLPIEMRFEIFKQLSLLI